MEFGVSVNPGFSPDKGESETTDSVEKVELNGSLKGKYFFSKRKGLSLRIGES